MNSVYNKNLKILALDDDPVAREYIKMTLKDHGDLFLAGSRQQFFQILNDTIPDIFLLDVTLPDGNGIDLCREMKQNSNFKDSFFIILTSRNDRETIEKAYSSGADEYIRKPFIQYELVSKIHIIKHIISVRNNLQNAYQTQLDHNIQLYKLSNFVKNGILAKDKEETLRNTQILQSMIELTYIEIIKVRGGIPLSILQKQIVKNTPVISFKEIENEPNIFNNIEHEIKFFKSKKNDREIYNTLFSVKFNNTIYGYILIQRLDPFSQNDKEIISLYLDYTNLLNERISSQGELSRKNEEYRKEIDIIRRLEVSKLPDFKLVHGFDTAFTFMPAQELSGDFFDGFFLDDDIYQIILCDVSGHGIASSYVGNQIRTMFREKSAPGKKPSEIVKEINSQLAVDLKELRYYCTAQVVQIYFDTNTILFLSAGHPEAIVKKKKGMEISLTKSRSPVIGLFEDETYNDEIINMEKGDVLFLYTDGLIEEHSPDFNNMFGIKNVIESLKKTDEMNSVEVLHHCLGDFYEFNGYRPQSDDITLICIKKD
ncbi:MAG TPA: fused response regulator/phosphatase [Spirochaetota bacterium]|nr:fused response regulator/phosphatase [Spirochaetota bacterium]